MVLGGHLVPRVPVDFPATTDREARIELHIDVLVAPDRVRRRHISDVVVEVQVLDVPRVLRSDLLQTILAVAALVEVDSAELALELRSDVLHGEVLVYADEAPV